MGWQRTIVDVVWFGAGSARLVIMAAVEIPVALKLRAGGLVGQRRFNLVPARPAVLVHVARNYTIGNALVAQLYHQPVEQGRRIVLVDRRPNGTIVCLTLVYTVSLSCK